MIFIFFLLSPWLFSKIFPGPVIFSGSLSKLQSGHFFLDPFIFAVRHGILPEHAERTPHVLHRLLPEMLLNAGSPFQQELQQGVVAAQGENLPLSVTTSRCKREVVSRANI